MSEATKAQKQRARKARKNRHKGRMRVAATKRRGERYRKGRHQAEPELSPWPDTTGMNEEEAARVIGEFLYWEDYADRNPASSFGAPE